ncbi:hypothetical protein PC116_g14900 [Phytophthora cactorum]|uniref:Uncharacterized protein n=1 Tax=Phytophthora cactorum TaxID=29920 RepID=A0A8T1E920_9STRA|nr:hypothetical protein PC114_g11609 [Phytophthora cactorum]KAG2947749.1 hypothetical protein PC117_g6582 [Phytophthora cactorum]KAG3017390.1 hypothetical protein PC119_g11048 [Phytophthora cactorum]KAG4237036.1 hypothetical protein PC116_g14900 [Phytophthora cactorum]
MGHISKDTLIKTQRSTRGITSVKQGVDTLCSGCMKSKQRVMTFPSRSLMKTTRVLERMHMNVTRLLRALSHGGAMYVLTLVDEYSRYVVTYFIKN